MFGYVNVNRKELSEEDTRIYKNFYCGLCQKLKEIAGTKGQMLLNYDMTFLAILLSGLYELPIEESQFTCKMHPTQKKHAVFNEAVDYAAAMDIVMSYFNLMDDYEDEGNRAKKKLGDSIKKDYDKIKMEYPRQTAAVEKYIHSLHQAEKRREDNLDKVSGYTGEMMEEIFDWKEQDIWSKDLRSMGFYLGKFIYLLDAYEDREKDEKSGNYNPLLILHKQCSECYETLCRQTLTTLMAECAKAFERMPILQYTGILRNVIYSGIWSHYEYLQLKDNKRKDTKDGSVQGTGNSKRRFR